MQAIMHAEGKWSASNVSTIDGRPLEVRSFSLTGETQVNAEGDWVRERVWVVGNRKPYPKVLLPTPPMVRDSPFPFGRFVVLPNEQVIIGDRKVGSGMNAAFVFRRVGGLHFRLVDRVSLNERIYRKYGPVPKRLRGSGTYCDTLEFVLFQSWLNAGRDALLACLYGEDNGMRAYLVSVNTQTGHLSGHQPIQSERVLLLGNIAERFPETRLHPMSQAQIAAFSTNNLKNAIDEIYARRDCIVTRDPKRLTWLALNGYASVTPGKSRAVGEADMFPTERANLALLSQVLAAREHKQK